MVGKVELWYSGETCGCFVIACYCFHWLWNASKTGLAGLEANRSAAPVPIRAEQPV